MSSSSSRDKILRNIRNALAEKNDIPFQNKDFAPIYPKLEDDTIAIFAQEFNKVGGNFIFCETLMDFAENLILLMEKKQWEHLYCWENPLQEVLDEIEFPYFKTHDKFLTHAEVGLTSCEALIARNGSVLISNHSHSGRKLSIYPPNHIVLAFSSQIVEDIQDAFDTIKEKYGNKIPSMLSIVTGPSRTADIEKTLVMGAHGPKEMIVFVIDKL